MTTATMYIPFRRSALALAVCAALVPALAHAEDDEVPARISETTVNFGVGAVDGGSADRAIFGQYNGFRSGRNSVANLGLDYILRDHETQTWVDLNGSNLLNDTRELNLVWKNPGNWKFTANYGELVRYEPNTVNTGLLGAGTTNPTATLIGAGTGTDLELKTKRTSLGIGFSKIISATTQFQVDVKTENKEGSRLFGIGMICSPFVVPGCAVPTGALLMAPEPINSNHSQIDARMSYALEKLRFSVGYYGSFYKNANNRLNVSDPGAIGDPTLANMPVALAPDNQAHQVDLSGNYDFTNSTRGTFKLAYSTAMQNDDFASSGLTSAPVGSSSLGGQVNTSLIKLGLSARPIAKLSLVADVRYEDKEDKTSLAKYDTTGTTTNHSLPNRKTRGKLQAGWQFSNDYRGTLGADYEAIDRGGYTSTSNASSVSALRQKTEEMTYSADMRRRMSDNFSGSLGVSTSQRNGSNWLKPNVGTGVTEVANATTGFAASDVFMPTLADRKRDKIKLFADWQPNDQLSVQLSAEEGTDKYSTPSVYGLQKTRMSQLSLDLSYAVNYAWTLTGYASQGTQTFNQSRAGGYVLAFDNTNLSTGFGFTGKMTSKWDVGGSITFMDDKSVYAQAPDAATDAYNRTLLSNGGLPDIMYQQRLIKLFGKYAVDKNTSVRLDVAYQFLSANDWTWSAPYSLTDGSTVTQKATQNVAYMGVTYQYLWR